MIKIQNLKKSFGNHQVLKGVDLEIPANKIVFIMGQSGAGKSVLLKHIIGFMKPDEGEIWFEGKNIVNLSEKELQKIRRKIGYLFQEGALFDSITVAENVAFPLKEHFKLSQKEIEKKVDELLKAVNLLEAKYKYPSELSGGMKKRAALARTLALNPKIILFDEPTTGLDPILQYTILNLIKELKEKFYLTCVIVSHDLHLALNFGDFLAFLYQGKIVETGTPKEILHSSHPFVKNFIQTAFLNFTLKEKIQGGKK